MESVKDFVETNFSLSAALVIAMFSMTFYFCFPVQQCFDSKGEKNNTMTYSICFSSIISIILAALMFQQGHLEFKSTPSSSSPFKQLY